MSNGDSRYVVVGFRSADCVLADWFSVDPGCQVALLEAGGPDRKLVIRRPAVLSRLFMSEYDWSYRSTEQPQLAGHVSQLGHPAHVAEPLTEFTRAGASHE